MSSAHGPRNDPPLAAPVEFRALLDELTVMVAYWDSSVRNVYANHALTAWFRTTPDAVAGSHLGELVPLDLYDRLLPHVTAALAGTPSEVDVPVVDPDGGLRQLGVVLVPHGSGADVAGFSMVCTDITDRVRAQQAEQLSAHEVAAFMERERIAERLHQEALQQLFSALLSLGRRADEDPAVARAVESVELAIADLREVSEHQDLAPTDGVRRDAPASPWKVRELVEVLDKLPAAVAFWDNDLRVRFTNATANLWLGHTRTSAYGMPGREFLGEELFAANLPLMQAAVGGEEQRFVRTLGVGDEARVVQFQYVPNRVHGAVDGFFVLGTDLTELVQVRSVLQDTRADVDRLTRAYRTLAQANQAILRAEDEGDLYAEICRVSVECGGYLGAWVGCADDAGRVAAMAQAGALGDYIAQLDIRVAEDDPRGRGPTGVSLREGRPVYSQNFMADPSTRLWRPAAREHGIAASATIPLRRDGTTVAALNLYSDDPIHFDDHMRSLMEGMAENVSYALASIEDRRRLRRLNGPEDGSVSVLS